MHMHGGPVRYQYVVLISPCFFWAPSPVTSCPNRATVWLSWFFVLPYKKNQQRNCFKTNKGRGKEDIVYNNQHKKKRLDCAKNTNKK